MATSTITTSDLWQKVIDDGVEFLLENMDHYHACEYRYDDSLPTGDVAAHTLPPGGCLIRAGLSGAVYVRSNKGCKLVFSVGLNELPHQE